MKAITSTRERDALPGRDPATANGEASARGRRPAAFVQSLERGLAVIQAFDGNRRELTLSEVARQTGLTRAAARRFLLTLVELGYVSTDGRLFSLRPRVLDLGYAYLSSMTVPEMAMPHMERLAASVQESCSMAVLDGTDIVYIARVPAKRIMTVSISVGTRFPAFATSLGRVLLAALPEHERAQHLPPGPLAALTPFTITEPARLDAVLAEVARQGYAVVLQELEEGLRSIAVPVHDRSGVVVAALNLSDSAQRGTREAMLRDLLLPLQTTAREIERDLRRG